MRNILFETHKVDLYKFECDSRAARKFVNFEPLISCEHSLFSRIKNSVSFCKVDLLTWENWNS